MLAVALALILLGASAALTLRQMIRSLPDFSELWARLNPRIDSVALIGAPALLAEPLAVYLREPGACFSSRVASLPKRFAAVQAVRVRHDWLHHSARVEVRLKRALGRAFLNGRPAGFVDEEGNLFVAPDGLYPQLDIILDIGRASPDQRRELAAALELIGQPSVLPAPLERVRYAGPSGWELALKDGSLVLWGDWRWTPEKLERLREALVDARRSFPGACVADLRYFEDGRLLVRPLHGRSSVVL